MNHKIPLFVKIKVLVKRQQTYLSMVNFVMIGYLFVKDTGWRWYYWLFVVLYPVWIWIDAKFIHGHEVSYEFMKSPHFKRILSDDALGANVGEGGDATQTKPQAMGAKPGAGFGMGSQGRKNN